MENLFDNSHCNCVCCFKYDNMIQYCPHETEIKSQLSVWPDILAKTFGRFRRFERRWWYGHVSIVCYANCKCHQDWWNNVVCDVMLSSKSLIFAWGWCMWGLIHRGETQGFFYWYSPWHHEANSNVNVSQMEACQSLMSDSVWMLKYLQMSFAHGADLPWAVFKPSGLLLNVIVRRRNCTQMIRSEGHSVPLFMCSCIQKVAEKVYYNAQIKVQKSSFWPSQGALQQPKRFKNPL